MLPPRRSSAAREQAILREALDAALAGRGALVLIGGEAGIGKTALAEWTLAQAAGLSAREVEVLGRVAAGESNREIAAALALSVRTVEKHLAHTYAKLGARGRADAAAYAARHGLLPGAAGRRRGAIRGSTHPTARPQRYVVAPMYAPARPARMGSTGGRRTPGCAPSVRRPRTPPATGGQPTDRFVMYRSRDDDDAYSTVHGSRRRH